MVSVLLPVLWLSFCSALFGSLAGSVRRPMRAVERGVLLGLLAGIALASYLIVKAGACP
jgi:hypothetical protein